MLLLLIHSLAHSLHPPRLFSLFHLERCRRTVEILQLLIPDVNRLLDNIVQEILVVGSNDDSSSRFVGRQVRLEPECGFDILEDRQILRADHPHFEESRDLPGSCLAHREAIHRWRQASSWLENTCSSILPIVYDRAVASPPARSLVRAGSWMLDGRGKRRPAVCVRRNREFVKKFSGFS
jgi:hypothetical protein